MFKKRQKKQAVDFEQEMHVTQAISTNPNESQQPSGSQISHQPPPKPKNHSLTLGQLQNNANTLYQQRQSLHQHTIQTTSIKQKYDINEDKLTNKQQEDQQLQKCFEEFKKYNEESERRQQVMEIEENKSVHYLHRDKEDSEDEREVEIVERKHMEEMVIEDKEDQVEILEYREDLGEISPQEQSSQQYEDCYENELIRKNVSRHTYLQLSSHLKGAHKLSQKQKILKSLDKVSETAIRKKIQTDLRAKRSKRDILHSQMNAYHQKNKNRFEELAEKKQEKQNLQKKFRQIESIMQFIFYYGHQITEFSQIKVIELLNQQKNKMRMQKIKKHRTKLIKKREDYKKRKNKNKIDQLKEEQNDNDQQYISLGKTLRAGKMAKNKKRRTHGKSLEEEQEEDVIDVDEDFPQKKIHKYAMNSHYIEEQQSEQEDDFMFEQ